MKLENLNIAGIVISTVASECARIEKETGSRPNSSNIIDTVMDSYKIEFKRQGNFTVAVILHTKNPLEDITVGVAKRHPNDEQDPVRAHATALNKAVCALVRKMVT